MSISSDIQKLDPGATIELFKLDTSMLPEGSSDPFYMHAGTNELKTAVVWQGNQYNPMPIAANGFTYSGQGTLPRPTLQVANVNGLITGLLLDLGDLVGARITRQRTLVKYLDAVNFASGVNPSADPTAHFPDELWSIRRKSKENKILVEFELGVPFDAVGFMLPGRPIIANVCVWKYRGGECGYVPGAMFKADDTPTNDPSQDVCGKREGSCKLRWGPDAELPYGSFPGAGLLS